MSKIMPISEVKTRLPELVSGVAEREEDRRHPQRQTRRRFGQLRRVRALEKYLGCIERPGIDEAGRSEQKFLCQGAARTVLRSGFRRIARCEETSEEIVAIYRPDIPRVRLSRANCCSAV
jgi:hypothetical protein